MYIYIYIYRVRGREKERLREISEVRRRGLEREFVNRPTDKKDEKEREIEGDCQQPSLKAHGRQRLFNRPLKGDRLGNLII